MDSNKRQFLSYQLSETADLDLVEIYEYSLIEFGFEQAEEYLDGFHHLFNQLTNFPNEGVLRKDIGLNILSIPYGSHLVFYSIAKNSISIIRVLHHSQNTLYYFK
ncbi:type II toxin-antitoxin system RelE/ParE family toxin [Aequorivita xiaoshiensis]|uniref:Toxin n=1 Tax=Aequorivita xiaoshiensis TaxID=2874476 RepID=A0A9X1QYH7_9FLAO|nr:type II toxin-antitoxin system RelE/ParE family toxin [Aequorivita xiaoshiensis]MCG2429920.1 type II toxin-antitoxin system RelE/ParE family toxin [Aequorivita xiaoshiensis]